MASEPNNSSVGITTDVIGTVNADTIELIVPFETDVTGLIPEITIDGASVNPANRASQDFTNPVIYTVTAADSSTKVYTVKVRVGTGYVTQYTTGDGNPTFNMVGVGAGFEFRQGMDDNGDVNVGTAPATATVENAFDIGQTEVTYELWNAVYVWATHPDRGPNQYTFANPGIIGDTNSGSNQQPVTSVNWRDAIVWCNALTEYYNAQNGTSLDCVYYTDEAYSSPLRESTNNSIDLDLDPGTEDNPYIKTVSDGNTDMANCTAKGFRLPTTTEWGAAARWEGDTQRSADAYELPAGQWWTAGNYASGGTGPYTGVNSTDYPNFNPFGWYGRNTTTAPDGNTESTQPVAQKEANALGLYDMSGNVLEWNFEWAPGYSGEFRVPRGGAWWFLNSSYLQVGRWGYNAPNQHNDHLGLLGFRFVRTL